MKAILSGVIVALAMPVALAQSVKVPGPVVDTAWLAVNLERVQVVDVRSNPKSFAAKPEFEEGPGGKKTLSEVGGHIAGAHLIDMKAMRTDRQIAGNTVKYMIPTREAFESAVRTAGVSADKPIVLVPVGQEVADIDDALRVYWQFKIYGEDNIAVLDGGMAAWLIEGRAYQSTVPPGHTGNWAARADRSAQFFADSDDVARAIAGRNATLVDSRDARQFHGLVKRDYVGAAGHLEGAKLYPTDLLMKNAGGALKFMSPATYAGLMAGQGIDPKAPAITYCNSGHLSSGTWFVLSELLGNRQARLYDGSLHQWTLEKRPVVGAVPLN